MDPREHLEPETAPFISDAAVEDWRLNHRCLCGCGKETNRVRDVVDHEWSFFLTGHNRLVAPAGFWRGKYSQTPEARQRISKGKRLATIDSAGIGMVLEDYLETTGMQGKDFAVKAGVSRRWLSQVKTGTKKRISRAYAAKLLAAMGEEIPPHLLPGPSGPRYT